MFAMAVALMTMIINFLSAINVTTKFVIGTAISNLGPKIVLQKKRRIFTVNFVYKMILTFTNETRKAKK